MNTFYYIRVHIRVVFLDGILLLAFLAIFTKSYETMNDEKKGFCLARHARIQMHGGVRYFRSRHSIAISILERRMNHKPDTPSTGNVVTKVSWGLVPEVSRAICLVRYTYTRLCES